MGVPDDPSDLLRRLKNGDADAAGALARRACRLALRTAATILQGRDEAGDVAQEVAIDVLRSISQLRDPDAFDVWVHRITVRHALRLLRRHQAKHVVEIPLSLIAEFDEPTTNTMDHASLMAIRSALTTALADLPPKQRLALALRYVHDLPDAQIAAALDCRIGTAHALLSRGRAALRDHPQLTDLAPPTNGKAK